MKLFHKIQFATHDPLDNGLKDEIVAEQSEDNSFRMYDDISGDELTKQWATIAKDIEKDPDWFSFDNS
jgi:hypothetical protein